MDQSTLKVAFTGPSGTGKTTLVQFVKEELGLTWLNGSSGGLKDPEKNKELYESGLNVGKGHKEVIQSGHRHPSLAWENQRAISAARAKLILNNKHFVTDRSPIDILVYATIQCGPYITDKDIQALEAESYAIASNLTHIIYIPTMWSPVEDNGSRIPNFYYQKAMGSVFEMYLDRFKRAVPGQKILYIDTSNLMFRKELVTKFLKG